jgi:hypothetical protein
MTNPRDEMLSDEKLDELEVGFDDWAEQQECATGLAEFRDTLSAEAYTALSQFLTLPIFEIVDCEGEKGPTKQVKKAVTDVLVWIGSINHLICNSAKYQ